MKKKILSKQLGGLVIAWNKLSDFKRARLKLTIIYITILVVVLNIFTISIFYILQHEEILHQEKMKVAFEHKTIEFPDRNITILEMKEVPVIDNRLGDLINLQHGVFGDIKDWILIIEAGLLLIVGIISYFLSGITLSPIEEKTRQQKIFLADVSHELKNPLSAIRTSVQVSKSQSKWKAGEINELLLDINHEVEKLIKTTEDLILLERITTSKSVKISRANIEIENIIKTLSAILKSKNITVKTEFNTDIEVIKDDFNHVFFNLLHNAVKFSNQNGRIEIITEQNTIKIIDEGVGIPEKSMKYIFNRFFKSDSSRNQIADNGVGLGLSIVKRICNKNNWKITIKHNKPRGVIAEVSF